MFPSSPATTAADVLQADSGQRLSSAQFVATLRMLSNEAESRSVRTHAVRQVNPAPILCPRPDSYVRFMPLTPTAAPVLNGGSIWIGDDTWTFLDFAAFDGADFAYAACRCLLHGAPSKKQIAAVASGSPEQRLMLLLAVDRKARRRVGGGKLINLDGTRALYAAYRTSRKLKLVPVALFLSRCLAWRARTLFSRQRDLIVQRRWMLIQLGILSSRP